jgi:hypothetical protein
VPDTGLRSIDLRFLLPELPASVRLVGEPAGWREGLGTAGIPVVDGDAPLTVAAAGHAAEAAGTPNVIVLGLRGARALRARGYVTRVILVRPRLLVPVDAPAACTHALLAPHPQRSRGKRLAARIALTALRLGIPVAPAAIVGTRRAGRPALLDAAAAVVSTTGDDWYVLRGGGDDLQRLVFLCFDGGSLQTAVKFTRVAGNAGPFERDAAAGAALARLPAALREHAVQHYGRFDVDGLEAVAESAARGVPLQDLLEAGNASPHVVDAVSQWIVDLGGATRNADGVFQHMDLGTWNVLVDGQRFTVVDWESSRTGPPLWDLAYFLTDALTAAGQRDPEDRVREMLALHRGEAEASGRFFRWVEHGARAAGVPWNAVGEVVLLGWEHHGRSQGARSSRGRMLGGETLATGGRGPLERLGGAWRDDPELGASWRAFDRWRAAHASA